MLVLGLDTSSAAVSAGLCRVGAEVELVAERVVVDARRHGELLAQGVRDLLLEAGPPAAVVVGLGPGPFTGLRVGLVTAAALCDALGVPAYGVCSLDGLGVRDGWALGDARRKEVYWARYSSGERVDGPGVARPAELALGGDVVGAGAVLHGVATADAPQHPSVRLLVERAADRVRGGAPSEALTPLYLRRPDAVEPGAPKRVTA